jgi:hypothetical protein
MGVEVLPRIANVAKIFGRALVNPAADAEAVADFGRFGKPAYHAANYTGEFARHALSPMSAGPTALGLGAFVAVPMLMGDGGESQEPLQQAGGINNQGDPVSASNVSQYQPTSAINAETAYREQERLKKLIAFNQLQLQNLQPYVQQSGGSR